MQAKQLIRSLTRRALVTRSSTTGSLIAACMLLSLSSIALANKITPIDDDTREFGPYTVYFTTLNSTYIPAEVAAIHNLTRAKDQTLVNVAVKETASGKSVMAKVTGTATNLMQQNKKIDFKHIAEPDSNYYIGNVKHANEELFHIDIKVQPSDYDKSYPFRVTRKFYTE